jgi:hypothetical protein
MGSMIACQSGAKRMVENSLGYRLGAVVTPEMEAQPDWVKELTSTGNNHGEETGTFFIGMAEGKPSMEEASSSAEVDASNQISKNIGLNVSSVINMFQSDTEAKAYVASWERSATTFSGAKRVLYYWERFEEKNLFTVNYWVQYFISQDKIDEAQKNFIETDKFAQLNRRVFNDLKRDFEGINSRIETNPQTEDYSNLLEIKTRLQGLEELKEDPDPSYGAELLKLIAEVQKAILKNDPLKQVAILNASIADLEGQLKVSEARNNNADVLNARIARLEGELAGAQAKNSDKEQDILDRLGNVENSVRNIPQGTQVPLVVIASVRRENLHIAENMTTNADFLAYLTQRKLSTRRMEGIDPQNMKKPITNIEFIEAAFYCNWLSEYDGYISYYDIDERLGSVKVPNQNANGYRLPTERELRNAIEAGIIRSQGGISRLEFDDEDDYDRGAFFDLVTSRVHNITKDISTGFMVVRNAW